MNRFQGSAIFAVVGIAALSVMVGVASAQPSPSASAAPSKTTPVGSASAPVIASASSSAVVPLPTSAEVLVLHGSNAGTGIDPKIGQLKPQLSKPPFSAYDSYKLLNQQKVQLVTNNLAKQVLPGGGTLSLTLKGPAPQPNRFSYAAGITSSSGKPITNVTVSSAVNDYFFIVAQSYQGGSLVVGIKLN